MGIIQQRARERNQQWYLVYKLSHPCTECGWTEPCALQPHHRDLTTKYAAVRKLVHGTYSIARIESELAKCDMLCANCHHRQTTEQFGSYKLLTPQELAILAGDMSLPKGRRYFFRNRLYVLNWLLEHSCECGEDDPIVLGFHHLDPEQKDKKVAEMLRGSRSVEAIQAEIDKCEVQCANCHAKETAAEYKWYTEGV